MARVSFKCWEWIKVQVCRGAACGRCGKSLFGLHYAWVANTGSHDGYSGPYCWGCHKAVRTSYDRVRADC